MIAIIRSNQLLKIIDLVQKYLFLSVQTQLNAKILQWCKHIAYPKGSNSSNCRNIAICLVQYFFILLCKHPSFRCKKIAQQKSTDSCKSRNIANAIFLQLVESVVVNKVKQVNKALQLQKYCSFYKFQEILIVNVTYF